MCPALQINTNQTINRDSPADRQMLVNNILHCSDIGNPCLPVHMSQEWAKAIQQEFYQQVGSSRVSSSASTNVCGTG